MIQVSKDKIYFRLPDADLLSNGDARTRPLVKDLISAHICSNCGVLVQAVYKTESRIIDQTESYFRLERPMGPGQFALSTARHEVAPQYRSYLITAGGMTTEMIREKFHFNLLKVRHNGCCKVSQVVYNPGGFNLIRYLFGLAKVMFMDGWYPTSPDVWAKLRLALAGSSQECNEANARQLYKEVNVPVYGSRDLHIPAVEDVTGTGAPLWLLSRGDWSYYTFSSAILKLVLATPSQGAKAV